jgi:hypothetical protein
MKENSFEWFAGQVENVRKNVETSWPEWMKRTSDVASAAFPVVGKVDQHPLEADSIGQSQPVRAPDQSCK